MGETDQYIVLGKKINAGFSEPVCCRYPDMCSQGWWQTLAYEVNIQTIAWDIKVHIFPFLLYS